MSKPAAIIIAVVLAALASLSFIPQGTLSSWEGFLGAKGDLRFTYVSGSSPISRVQFQLPQDIARNIRVTSVPDGWAQQEAGDVLTISGGSLRQGQSLEIEFTFLEYVAPGTLPVKAEATTAEGNTITAGGTIIVGQQVIMLKVLNILERLTVPLFAFSALLLGYWLDWWRVKKKTTLPAEKEGEKPVCEACGGSGKIRKSRWVSEPCGHCKQTGRDICHYCGGTGRYGVGLTVPQTQDEVDSLMKCDYCEGSGFKNPPVVCCMCRGKRKISVEEFFDAPCPGCGGTGHR